MRALRTTLTVALLSQTFVAAWKGSPVEQDGGEGWRVICDGADVCEWTEYNRRFYPTSVQVGTSIHYNRMHSQTHLGAIRCRRGTGKLVGLEEFLRVQQSPLQHRDQISVFI